MAKGLSFDWTMARPEAGAQRRDEPATRNLLVLGDFSGRGARGEVRPPSHRRPVLVDEGRIDPALATFAPELALPLSAERSAALSFQSLDDFHPDHLLTRVTQLAGLFDLHRGLRDPARAAASAELARALFHEEAAPGAAAPPPAAGQDAGLIEQLLGRKPSAPAPQSGRRAEIDRLISEIAQVTPAPAAGADSKPLLARLEYELSRRLRATLHHPDFQALEAVWRGLDFLLRRIGDAEPPVRVFVADVSLLDLAADLLDPARGVESSGLATLLGQSSRDQLDGEPWDLVLGLYDFTAAMEQLALLQRTASACAVAGAPLLAGADYTAWLAALKTDDAKTMVIWDELRQRPEMDRLSLALPHVLLRLPYGAATDPVDGFPFEELADGDGPDALAWGHPAWACAVLMLGEGETNRVEDLPALTRTIQGETRLTPCAEVWMTDQEAARWRACGFVPLRSIAGQNALAIGAIHPVGGSRDSSS